MEDSGEVNGCTDYSRTIVYCLCLKSYRKVVYLHQVWPVFVENRTESQSTPERAGPVFNFHTGVTSACDAAPLQHCFW